MKAVIIGAGIIGAMTAYRLHREGARVTVIDRRPRPGSECSFANGGQLSYSHCEPWPAPELYGKLPLWALRRDAPFRFYSADKAFPAKAFGFLRACRRDNFIRGREAMAELAALSKQALAEAARDTGIAFAKRDAGILHIARTEKKLDTVINAAREKEALNIRHHLYSRVDTEQAGVTGAAGGVFYPDDETGDVRECCAGLIAYLQANGARCRLNLPVQGLLYDKANRVRGLYAGGEDTETDADIYIICAGAASAALLKDSGLRLPLFPVKGYSVTYAIPAQAQGALPVCGVTDSDNKIVYSRLGHILRAAGMADIDGFNTHVRRRRVAFLKRQCESLFPFCAHAEPVQEWACLRPFLPDGLPAIGRAGAGNLFINTGHGSLGWTNAAGSAALLAGMILREEDVPAGFSVKRF